MLGRSSWQASNGLLLVSIEQVLIGFVVSDCVSEGIHSVGVHHVETHVVALYIELADSQPLGAQELIRRLCLYL